MWSRSVRSALLVLAIASAPLSADESPSLDETGLFYVQSFAPESYGGTAQNLAITQGKDDLIYVGNGAGVLEYDGASWRLIPIPNGGAAFSLAVDESGRVFVGSEGDVGFLAPDPLGQMRFESLVEKIPEEDRDFSHAWTTFVTSEGVYFQTPEVILRWTGEEMRTWRPQKRHFYLSYVVNDTYYVRAGNELFTLSDDELLLQLGGESFVGQRIRSLLPYAENAFLVATAMDGIYRCLTDGPPQKACQRFNPDLTEMLANLRPFHTTVLPDGRLAIGTARRGLMLLDQEGRLQRIVDEASGLRTNRVWFTYLDRQGGLWLALDDGLARVEVTSPLTYFDKATGLTGAVTGMARHRGHFYASTTLGLYKLGDPVDGTAPRFAAIPEVQTPCWSLLATPQGLVAGCYAGGYNLDQRRWVWSDLGAVMSMHYSEHPPNHLYLATQKGVFRVDPETWHEPHPIESIHEGAGGIVGDDQGRLWMHSSPGTILRFEPAPSPEHPASVLQFGSESGLPPGVITPHRLDDRLLFYSPDGLLRLDPQNGTDRSARFVPDTTFDTFLDSSEIVSLTEDEKGRVWLAAGQDSGVAVPQGNGSYSFAPTALRRVPNMQPYTMYAETEGPLWVGVPHGIIRLDTSSSPDLSQGYSARIRRITTAAGTLLYDGAQPRPQVVVPYAENALRFVFAAPRFDAPEATEYRTRLGDENWSAWSTETDKDYTNLWEGRYVFHVQARDVYGVVSREDRFSFRVLAPWYRSWWAYTLYSLSFAAMALTFVRLQRKKLRREQAINARLREVDKLKDEILANTSHELRTPLFGLTGLADSLLDGAAGEIPADARPHLEMISNSGRRLSRLINDILDHSRLKQGNLELQLGPVDLRSLTETVLTLQSPLVVSKPVELRNAVSANLPAVEADEARVEQILHNLVGNAIKFTPAGYVEVRAQKLGDSIEIVVEDTGIGIAEEDHERIFHAFEQVDSGTQRSFGGTGLGLGVTRRLVELHEGTIGVESEIGQGARFKFTLPVSDEPSRPPSAPDPPISRPISIEPMPDLPENAEELSREARTEPKPKPTIDERGIPGASILVVDDEPVNRMVLSLYLTKGGYQVAYAEDGPEALRLADKESFDLVILDVMMPEMSGYEVCRALRKRHRLVELPVIFLTAKNQVSNLVDGLNAGGNDYLPKPVDREELLARVSTHLELLAVHRRLARRNAELAKFNDTVAHDLRNPLTTITNYLTLVRRDAALGKTDHIVNDLDHLDTAAENLQQLIDELFELSKDHSPSEKS